MKKLILLAVMCGTSSAFATDYNLINDWSLGGPNPNGAWSYGTKIDEGIGVGDFGSFMAATTHDYPDNDWDRWIVDGTADTCQIWYAQGGLWSFPAQSVIANAWDNYSSVVHWAGDAGTYDLSAIFQGGGYTTPTSSFPDTMIYVIKNDSTILFQQELLGFNNVSTAQQITINPGDYLDFVVAQNTSGVGESRASIDASLTAVAVPEPATMALIGLSGLLLLRKRR